MAIFPVADYVQNSGKVNIFVAFPISTYVAPHWPFSPTRLNALAIPGSGTAAYAQLFKLGESTNDVSPERENILEMVPGDSQGGNSGDGIEDQALGSRASINLRMSKWDIDVLTMIESLGGLYAGGRVTDASVGALARRDLSFRLLLYGVRDLKMVRNFPCCLVRGKRSVPMSSKWSELSLDVSAHRAPLGHWGAPALNPDGTLASGDLVTHVVENKDVTGTA